MRRGAAAGAPDASSKTTSGSAVLLPAGVTGRPRQVSLPQVSPVMLKSSKTAGPHPPHRLSACLPRLPMELFRIHRNFMVGREIRLFRTGLKLKGHRTSRGLNDPIILVR